MYETASKRVKKSKRCVLFVTFRPSQRTLFMARRNWVPLALIHLSPLLSKPALCICKKKKKRKNAQISWDTA